MKKLALLLGSLLVVGATASAKEAVVAPVEVSKEVVVVAEPVAEVVVVEETPLLKVTKFGMYTEIDNNAGSTDGDIGLTYLGTKLGLASGSGDWTYGVHAYRAWTLDSDEGVIDGANDRRLELDAWRNFNRTSDFKYSLGARARFAGSYDRYYARAKYSYGFVSGSLDLMHQSANDSSDKNDSHRVEVMPLNLTFGPLTLGYNFQGVRETGDVAENGNRVESAEHQLRAYFPLYSAGKFSSDAEIRLGLKKDSTAATKNAKDEEDYDFGDLQRYGINTSYQYSDNLSFGVSYLYEIVKYSTDKRDKYYGEFVAGWDYKF